MKTCGSENVLWPTQNVCSAEQEPLISAVKTDDIPLKSGSMSDRQCLLEYVFIVKGRARP